MNSSFVPTTILTTLSLILSTELVVTAQVNSQPSDKQALPGSGNPNPLLEPIWQGDIVHGESAVLFQEIDGGPFTAKLAFPVQRLITVHSSNREINIPLDQIAFEVGGQELRIAQSLKLNGIVRDRIYLPADSPGSYRHRVGHPDQWMLYGPGRWFHDHQIEVTYERKKQGWTSPTPAYAEKFLPKTIAKIKANQPLSIGVSGDSITTGLDSSSSANAAPFQPGYIDLVAQELRRKTGAEIKLENRAVAGWSVATGLSDLSKLLEGKPDLVIVAYGMNDVGRRDPDWYGKMIDQMLGQINSTLPETEVILVSTMVGNAEWVHTPRDMFEPYRDQLAKRVGPGVALADVTALWLELLKTKHDLDLTGNGLNHPNDFGHRLYAQAVLALLVQQTHLP